MFPTWDKDSGYIKRLVASYSISKILTGTIIKMQMMRISRALSIHGFFVNQVTSDSAR